LRTEGEVNDTDARLWHPWLRINRVLRVMLHTRWSAQAWSQVRIEFKRALALRRQIRRADQIIERNFPVSEMCQNHRTPSVINGHNQIRHDWARP
jgi:hypothetical protein